ncbi:cytochrome P450 [Delphinella strobiligena]|nr:cytochrome P450 [Delphinella strobiligena]
MNYIIPVLGIIVIIGLEFIKRRTEPYFDDPANYIPGPFLFGLNKWRLAFEDWKGTRTQTINNLHKRYGPIIRIAPNEIHFNSLSALKTIYGAGSKYGRTQFYRMFEVYGQPNIFTFHSTEDHSNRKKMLAKAVKEFMDLLEANGDRPMEIFNTLQYFSLDSITHFLYGSRFGGTSSLTGNLKDRELLNDVLDPARRRLSWFVVHLPKLTTWLYTREHLLERTLGIDPILPMKKPTTYTGIRAHALGAFFAFDQATKTGRVDHFAEPTIIAELWKSHASQKTDGIQDLDVASECADHLLAEVKAIWPSESNENGIPSVKACDKLVYLDAVIKETLRLYAPLPASEPRSLSTDSVIDSRMIPAGTVVAMSPYSLHRNDAVFKRPLNFDPERWLGLEEEVANMNRWFWAFSSGARMCIGMQ